MINRLIYKGIVDCNIIHLYILYIDWKILFISAYNHVTDYEIFSFFSDGVFSK